MNQKEHNLINSRIYTGLPRLITDHITKKRRDEVAEGLTNELDDAIEQIIAERIENVRRGFVEVK